MPWVAKVPRRSDFCGCPPCPLCYDYAPDLNVEEPDKSVEMIPGIVKMGLDLLGRVPTAPERGMLEMEALKCHSIKKAELERAPPPLEDLVMAYDSNQQEEYFNRQLLAAGAKAREAKEKKRDQNVLLDQVDMSKVKGPAPAAPVYFGATGAGPWIRPAIQFTGRTQMDVATMSVRKEAILTNGDTVWI